MMEEGEGSSISKPNVAAYPSIVTTRRWLYLLSRPKSEKLDTDKFEESFTDKKGSTYWKRKNPLEFKGKMLTFGSDVSCSVRINNNAVAPLHFKLIVVMIRSSNDGSMMPGVNYKIMLENEQDLPVFVNTTLVSKGAQEEVVTGDVIMIGKFKFLYEEHTAIGTPVKAGSKQRPKTPKPKEPEKPKAVEEEEKSAKNTDYNYDETIMPSCLAKIPSVPSIPPIQELKKNHKDSNDESRDKEPTKTDKVMETNDGPKIENEPKQENTEEKKDTKMVEDFLDASNSRDEKPKLENEFEQGNTKEKDDTKIVEDFFSAIVAADNGNDKPKLENEFKQGNPKEKDDTKIVEDFFSAIVAANNGNEKSNLESVSKEGNSEDKKSVNTDDNHNSKDDEEYAFGDILSTADKGDDQTPTKDAKNEGTNTSLNTESFTDNNSSDDVNEKHDKDPAETTETKKDEGMQVEAEDKKCEEMEVEKEEEEDKEEKEEESEDKEEEEEEEESEKEEEEEEDEEKEEDSEDSEDSEKEEEEEEDEEKEEESEESEDENDEDEEEESEKDDNDEESEENEENVSEEDNEENEKDDDKKREEDKDKEEESEESEEEEKEEKRTLKRKRGRQPTKSKEEEEKHEEPQPKKSRVIKKKPSIFANMTIVLTCIQSGKSRLMALITENRGVPQSGFASRPSPVPVVEGSNGKIAWADVNKSGSKLVVVTDKDANGLLPRSCTSLMALALHIPIVSSSWVTDSIETGEREDFEPYLLKVQGSGTKKVSQPIPFNTSGEKYGDLMVNDDEPLAVMVTSKDNKGNRISPEAHEVRELKTWEWIVETLGGRVVKPPKRHYDYELCVVFKDKCCHFSQTYNVRTDDKIREKRRRRLKKKELAAPAPVVSAQWIANCLIQNRLLAVEGYTLDTDIFG